MAKGNYTESKKFVLIQSSKDIRVSSGLQYEDFTKKDSDIPNRMKVAPQWPKMMVMIYKGQHTYPAEIANWNSVKALQNDGILTIGDYTDTDADNAGQVQKELTDAKEQMGKSLSEIAGE